MRARTHWSLPIATSRQQLGWRPWMAHTASMPGVPASAMQRGVLLDVPFIATSCRRSVSVNSSGTVPLSQAVVSDQ